MRNEVLAGLNRSQARGGYSQTRTCDSRLPRLVMPSEQFGGAPNPASSRSQSWHLEFGETVLKRLKIDPRSMLNQSLVGSPKIGQFSLLIQIFQDTDTADHRQ